MSDDEFPGGSYDAWLDLAYDRGYCDGLSDEEEHDEQETD